VYPLSVHRLITLLWGAFWTYWFVSALRVKRTKVKEGASRFFYLSLMAVGAYLIFSQGAAVSPLARRFLPHTLAVAFIGLVLTAAGLGLAVWARLHLGENWSASVTIKEGHDLIRSGPYAYLRHPIYSGILLALLGTVVALGEWRGLIGFCVILISLIIKAKREEAWLAREFGGSWQEHHRHAGFLLPKF